MLVFFKLLFRYKLQIPKEFKQFIRGEIKRMGPMTTLQSCTFVVFGVASLLWIFKGFLGSLFPALSLSDTIIALGASSLLFLPMFSAAGSRFSKSVLDAKDISYLPWNIFLLFGGGMALAKSLETTGLIADLTAFIMSLDISAVYVLIFVVATSVLVLTEIMSNVALCVVCLPVIINIGAQLPVGAVLFALPAALCSSFAFTLPISTPPNAIVFASDKIKASDMMKAGIVMNGLGLVITMTLTYFLVGLFY